MSDDLKLALLKNSKYMEENHTGCMWSEIRDDFEYYLEDENYPIELIEEYEQIPEMELMEFFAKEFNMTFRPFVIHYMTGFDPEGGYVIG